MERMLAGLLRRATGAGCAAALLVGVFGTGSAVAASTFSPNRFDDPVPPAGQSCTPPVPPNGCSLRGAIDAAHDGDTVQLGAGTYTLSLDELGFTKAITIVGAGPQATTVKQTGLGPVFAMDNSAFSWSIQGITITGGDVVGTSGANGSGAGADGQSGTTIGGGGIRTLGPLKLTDVVVSANKVTGGDGGKGAAGSATKHGGAGGDGGGAQGAGIEALSSLELNRVAVTGNIAHAGSPGAGGRGGSTTDGGVGGNGGFADGAGIMMLNGSQLFAADTLIANNQALPTAGGAGGKGGSSKGSGGAGGTGDGSSGGGLFSTAFFELTNVTFSGNLAAGSAGGPGGAARSTSTPSTGGRGGTGSGGFGGAISLFNGANGFLASLTIADNTATPGPGGAPGAGSDGGPSGATGIDTGTFGGNISLLSATVKIRDSIIARGHADAGDENCSVIQGSTLSSQGHNLEDRHQCITSAAAGDLLNASPGLGSLQDNGGPSETMALLAGSPAIRGGEPGCIDADGHPLTDDQRGLPRASPCDIGAFQGQPPVAGAPPAISGTSAPGATLTCAGGTFGGDQPLSSGFAWLRDGAAIAGASAAQYVVAAADVGHAVACRETVTNPYGSATATSAPVNVAVSPNVVGPVLTGLKLSPGKVRNRHQETISFTLNVAARVTFTLRRLAPGTKAGKRCVARKGKHRHGRRCTRLIEVRGGPPGVDGAAGSGHTTWKPHGLKAGKYQLTATPAGGESQTVKCTVAKTARRHHRK